MKLMRILGSASGMRTDADGLYLKSYVPPAMNAAGEYVGGEISVTDKVSEAMHFENAVSALNCYQQVNGRRPDGRPNRPLAAFHIEIDDAPPEST